MIDPKRYPPRKEGPGRLSPPAQLVPVREPSRGLRRRNEERQKRVKPLQFAEQAARCRNAPCACCGRKGASQPHHWPTIAAGGLDADTCPLCPDCHDAFHLAGSPEAFLVSHGCDVIEAIKAMRRKPDHDCEAFAVLVEDGRPGREVSVYVCQRCRKALPDEQPDPEGT